MKSCLLLLVLITSSIWARTSDCYKEVSQADKNECMSFERDKAIGDLVKAVTEDCANNLDVQDSKGGTIYPMLLDECMTRKFNELKKEQKK